MLTAPIRSLRYEDHSKCSQRQNYPFFFQKWPQISFKLSSSKRCNRCVQRQNNQFFFERWSQINFKLRSTKFFCNFIWSSSSRPVELPVQYSEPIFKFYKALRSIFFKFLRPRPLRGWTIINYMFCARIKTRAAGHVARIRVSYSNRRRSCRLLTGKLDFHGHYLAATWACLLDASARAPILILTKHVLHRYRDNLLGL